MYQVVNKHRKSSLNRPYYSKQLLEDKALKIIIDYDSTLLDSPVPIPIEEIIETKYNLDIDYKNLSIDGSILGLTTFETGKLLVFDEEKLEPYYINVGSGTIIIDSRLVEDTRQYGRYRFTCGHEFAHWELHRDQFFNSSKVKTVEVASVKCLNRDIENSLSNPKKTEKDWLEWQADYLSAAILMPSPTLRDLFIFKRSEILTKFESSNCGSFILSQTLIKELAGHFEVSVQAMSNRLRDLNLVL